MPTTVKRPGYAGSKTTMEYKQLKADYDKLLKQHKQATRKHNKQYRQQQKDQQRQKSQFEKQQADLEKKRQQINKQSDALAQQKAEKYQSSVRIGDQDIVIKSGTRGGHKRLVKELSQNSAFANKPASVRNVEKIANTLVTLESIDESLKQAGYATEAQKIQAAQSMLSSFLEAVSKNPELADHLANLLDKEQGSVNISPAEGDFHIKI